MSAKPISEASAKALLHAEMSLTCLCKNPFAILTPEVREFPADFVNKSSRFIAKPDALIKRRGKLNLLLLNKDLHDVKEWVDGLLGFPITIGNVTGKLNRFIVEPFVPHSPQEEYYVCIYTERDCNVILFYHEGGIDVGDVDKKAKRFTVPISEIMQREAASEPICTSAALLQSNLFEQVQDTTRRQLLAEFCVELHRVFDELHFTYLEINPLVICPWSPEPNNLEQPALRVHILDVAAKLDACAEYLFAHNGRWSPGGRTVEFPPPFGRVLTAEEAHVAQLDASSGASMKLSVLNPNGRVWTMCAGGGASVVYADTVCELATKVGRDGADELANYGEYSGAPSEGQTYEYAKTILALMTRSAPHPEGKTLLIGGGIANFTNVAATFKGIVRALTEYKSQLQAHRVQIYVRRAGPNYQEGLRIMRELATTLDIPIHVYGPETHMTAIVGMALQLSKVNGSVSTSEPPVVSAFPVANGGDAQCLPTKMTSPIKTQPSSWTELFTHQTRCIVWGLQTKAVQSMLDFDYMSNREQPSVACLVYPFSERHQIKVYWGRKEIFLPAYPNLSEAVHHHPDARVLVNFASFRVAYDVSLEAMQFDHVPSGKVANGCGTSPSAQIQCIAIIAEGIPEKLTRRLIHHATQRGVVIIGPATVGGVKAGCFKIGNTGGMVDNISAAKLYRPGSVAYVSRSGGLSNELNNIISRNSDGVEEGVAIGGDRYPVSTFLDHLLRFEANPNVAMMVMLGEVGGLAEYAVIDAVRAGRLRKPIVAWCIGTCAQLLSRSSSSIQFGHAGACAQSDRETATAKNAALSAVGVHVPASFDELGVKIRHVFDSLVKSGRLTPKPDVTPRPVPLDYDWAKELGLIRRPAAFTSTICDDRGSELTFAGMPITQVISEQLGIGGVLGLLWFKRRLPAYAAKFLELCLIITADHGPAVSGALNTIVTARAGKDLLSSLTAGLLTIGDRFGGALDGAARQFSSAFDAGLSAAEFVAKERRDSRLIMGIGHRVKSITNPDMRVRLLADYVHQQFPATPLVDYAFAVEKVTTSKRPNLILNVDGMIGVAMVDLLRHCGQFTREEADEYVNIGTLNGLFVLGRSIGFIGHYLDQKRLHQGLYRHPWEDISYLVPELDEGH